MSSVSQRKPQKEQKQKIETKQDSSNEDTDWRHNINWELVYKSIVIFVVGLVPFFIKDMIYFRQLCDSLGYTYQSIMFLPYSLLAAGALAVYRNIICFKMLHGLVYNNINSKFKGVDREVRTKKVIKWCSDIIYYSSTTIYSIIFFKHKSWFPLILEKTNWYDPAIFHGYPNRIIDDVTGYIEFYMIVQFGQHIYALFELIIVRRKTENKFYEWLLHHILAVTLIFYSVFNNYYIPGILILILHDVGDVFLAFFKVYGIFRTDTIFYINTFNMIISWFITRIYIYPKGCILPFISYYQNTLGQSKEEYATYAKPCYIYMLVLTCILFVMHLYWFATMLTMLFQHLKQIIRSSKPVTFQNDFDFHKKNQDKSSETH